MAASGGGIAAALHRVRQVVVSVDDRGPQINVVAWTAMVVMVLAVGTRLTIKYNAFRTFGWDDGFVTMAMVSAIGQAVTVSMQVSVGGLGRRISNLSTSDIQSFEQGQYASDILFVATLAFSKLSSLAYMVRFTPDKKHRLWGKAILLAICVWAIVAVFGVAFECHLPSPWAIVAAQCFNMEAFWDTIGVLDMLTDLALMVLPAWIIWNLQMARTRKAMVFAAFACRIILFPIVILRLNYLSFALSSSDKPFDYRNVVFTSVADANAVVLAACFPFLKPFMKGLDSGLLTSDLRVRGAKTTTLFSTQPPSAKVYPSGSRENGYPLQKVFTKPVSESGGLGFGRLRDDRIRHQVTIAHDPPQHDGESHTSVGSDQMIIKRTTEWNVDYDELERGLRSPSET